MGKKKQKVPKHKKKQNEIKAKKRHEEKDGADSNEQFEDEAGKFEGDEARALMVYKKDEGQQVTGVKDDAGQVTNAVEVSEDKIVKPGRIVKIRELRTGEVSELKDSEPKVHKIEEEEGVIEYIIIQAYPNDQDYISDEMIRDIISEQYTQQCIEKKLNLQMKQLTNPMKVTFQNQIEHQFTLPNKLKVIPQLISNEEYQDKHAESIKEKHSTQKAIDQNAYLTPEQGLEGDEFKNHLVLISGDHAEPIEEKYVTQKPLDINASSYLTPEQLNLSEQFRKHLTVINTEEKMSQANKEEVMNKNAERFREKYTAQKAGEQKMSQTNREELKDKYAEPIAKKHMASHLTPEQLMLRDQFEKIMFDREQKILQADREEFKREKYSAQKYENTSHLTPEQFIKHFSSTSGEQKISQAQGQVSEKMQFPQYLDIPLPIQDPGLRTLPPVQRKSETDKKQEKDEDIKTPQFMSRAEHRNITRKYIVERIRKQQMKDQKIAQGMVEEAFKPQNIAKCNKDQAQNIPQAQSKVSQRKQPPQYLDIPLPIQDPGLRTLPPVQSKSETDKKQEKVEDIKTPKGISRMEHRNNSRKYIVDHIRKQQMKEQQIAQHMQDKAIKPQDIAKCNKDQTQNTQKSKKISKYNKDKQQKIEPQNQQKQTAQLNQEQQIAPQKSKKLSKQNKGKQQKIETQNQEQQITQIFQELCNRPMKIAKYCKDEDEDIIFPNPTGDQDMRKQPKKKEAPQRKANKLLKKRLAQCVIEAKQHKQDREMKTQEQISQNLPDQRDKQSETDNGSQQEVVQTQQAAQINEDEYMRMQQAADQDGAQCKQLDQLVPKNIGDHYIYQQSEASQNRNDQNMETVYKSDQDIVPVVPESVYHDEDQLVPDIKDWTMRIQHSIKEEIPESKPLQEKNQKSEQCKQYQDMRRQDVPQSEQEQQVPQRKPHEEKNQKAQQSKPDQNKNDIKQKQHHDIKKKEIPQSKLDQGKKQKASQLKQITQDKLDEDRELEQKDLDMQKYKTQSKSDQNRSQEAVQLTKDQDMSRYESLKSKPFQDRKLEAYQRKLEQEEALQQKRDLEKKKQEALKKDQDDKKRQVALQKRQDRYMKKQAALQKKQDLDKKNQEAIQKIQDHDMKKQDQDKMNDKKEQEQNNHVVQCDPQKKEQPKKNSKPQPEQDKARREELSQRELQRRQQQLERMRELDLREQEERIRIDEPKKNSKPQLEQDKARREELSQRELQRRQQQLERMRELDLREQEERIRIDQNNIDNEISKILAKFQVQKDKKMNRGEDVVHKDYKSNKISCNLFKITVEEELIYEEIPGYCEEEHKITSVFMVHPNVNKYPLDSAPVTSLRMSRWSHFLKKDVAKMVAKGRDASNLFPAVVKNVVSKNIELKKLVYSYLERYAEEKEDLALLSISTFQRALKEPNQLIRAGALRVLSGIRVTMIAPIVMIAIRDAAADMSPYVRKTAAHAIPKLYSLDNDTKSELIVIIEKLLADRTVLVIGSAMMAFTKVCPERVDLIHKVYRKLCALLGDVDEWGQVIIVNTLTRYARTQFTNPQINETENNGQSFYDSDSECSEKDNAPMLDPDHKLLLRSARPLLQSRNAAVVMAVAQMYHHIGPSSETNLVVKALVRLLRSNPEVQELVLKSIVTITLTKKGAFDAYLKSFFVRTSDSTRVKLLKLTILTNIANESNISVILRELETYISSYDDDFVAATIQAIGRCACFINAVTDTCLSGLVTLLSNKNEVVVAESVVVIKRLLQTQAANPKDIIQQMIRLLDNIVVPQARASIIWLLGEHCRDIPTASNVLKKAAKSFATEEETVKLQVLNLALKLFIYDRKEYESLCHYIFSLAKYDQNYDVRDRARFLRTFIDNPNNKLLVNAANIFLATKPAPIYRTNEDTEIFQLGSLSHSINGKANGYEPLPPWPEVAPPSDVRDVEPIPENNLNNTEHKQEKNFDSWESESSTSESFTEERRGEVHSDSDDVNSTSSSKSEKSTDEEEEEEDEEEEEEEEESSSSEGEEDEDDEATDSAEGDDSEITNENQDENKIRNGILDNKKLEKTVESKEKSNLDLLLDLEMADNSFGPVLTPSLGGFLTPISSSRDGPRSDIQVMMPYDIPTTNIELLNRMSGKGLSITCRFTRNPHLFSPSMVNINLNFTNNGSEDINDIRLGQKNLSPGMNVHEFAQIATLGIGCSLPGTLGIDFNDSLNPANLEVISSIGKFNICIKPTIGELLRPVKVVEEIYLIEQSKLKGMNEHTGKVSSAELNVLSLYRCANLGACPSTQKGVNRFAGQTLTSTSLVLVTVAKVESGLAVTVNCEKLVIGSMLLNELISVL